MLGTQRNQNDPGSHEKNGGEPSLAVGRTIALSATLVALFSVIICAVCAAIALIGSLLVDLGLSTVDQLTSPANVVVAIIVGSIALASAVCIGVNKTLVSPLRRMTLAMGELARGDFSFRIDGGKKGFHIREVEEFAERFNVAAKELEGTEMMRSGFISDFSHEFRTPIMSLSGFAQLLMEEDLSEEERREYLEIIHDEAIRLSRLSERILLLSKIEATTILAHTEPVDISRQLRHAVTLMEPKLSSKKASIVLNVDDCLVQGDADYLSQLWINLLDNAVKFSPQGGRIDVALYGGRKDEEERRGGKGDCAVVWISDEGAGMDSDTREHIFDRFYQGDTSRASAGSGLGLSLCKRIVELHGGKIDVQSAPGKGSVFEVRLPVRHDESDRDATRF